MSECLCPHHQSFPKHVCPCEAKEPAMPREPLAHIVESKDFPGTYRAEAGRFAGEWKGKFLARRDSEDLNGWADARVKDALENAARLLEMSNAELLLCCGEMSMQELRTVQAVLKSRAGMIRRLAEGKEGGVNG